MSKNIRFGYGYLSTGATVTADYTASGYDASNAAQIDRATGWKSSGTATQRLKFALPSAITPTFIGICGGNWSSMGTVNLQHAPDGATWSTLQALSGLGALTDYVEDYGATIAGVAKSYWALQFPAPSAAPELALFYLGYNVELAQNDDVPGTEVDVYGVDVQDTEGGVKQRERVHRRLRRDILAFGTDSTQLGIVRNVIRGEGGPERPFFYKPLDEATSNDYGRAYLVGYEAATMEVKRRFRKYAYVVPLLEEV